MKHLFSKVAFLLVAATLLVSLSFSSQAQVASLYLGSIEGIASNGNLRFGQPITFVINAQYDGSWGHILGSTNGFLLSSPTSSIWRIPVGSWDTTSQLYIAYTGGRFVSEQGLDGMSVDTIGFGGFGFPGGGVASPFDEPLFRISTQFDSFPAAGGTFCIDSTSYRPAAEWIWSSFEQSENLIPAWGGGPYAGQFVNGFGYCFTIGLPEAYLYISDIAGLDSSNNIPLDTVIEIAISAQYLLADMVNGSTNGFRLNSPDGAKWDTATAYWETSSQLYQAYDGGRFINYFSWDGILADTVGFGGFSIFPPDAIAPFDESVFKIAITFNIPENWGRTFCIDSSFYRPISSWVWSNYSQGIYPHWSSQYGQYIPDHGYCFKIGPAFTCGDVNNDTMGSINVLDLSALISYIFSSGSIPAPLVRANVNCSSEAQRTVNVLDVVYLVQYLFNDGPTPCANCQF